LNGDVVEAPKDSQPISVKHEEDDDKPIAKNDLSSYKGDSRFLISIHDIRHAMLVTSIDYESKIKFESFFVGLINERKERFKVK
jgi:hypothetical protein